MQYIVTALEMKNIEKYVIEEVGIPSLVLMERASLSVTECIKKRFFLQEKICVVCGQGNNGADGVAIARQLMEENYNGKVFASDEFYLKAERELPNSEYYGEFWQIENGVGMYRSFLDEALFALENEEPSPSLKKTCATGVLAKPMISFIVDKAKNKWHNLECKVIEIENEFFGKNITVSGLITASDIIRTLKGKDLGDILLLPENMLRHEKDRFLDDVTIEELEKELKVKIKFVAEDGYEFVEALGE